MACANVGSANSDIAGLGIIISFALQAGLSLVLSIWSLSLSGSEPFSPIFIYLSLYWRCLTVMEKLPIRFLATSGLSAQFEGYVGGLRRRLMNYLNRNTINPLPLTARTHHACKREIIDEVITTISNLQVFNALAILIASLVQYQSMSLYHLRIVYDTSSFTCISVCASFTSASGSKGSIKNPHVIPPLVMFAIAYICFCVTLAIKLDGWDEELAGRCYNTQFTAAPSTTQPLGSYIYLIITSLYSLAALLICYTVSTAANVASSKSQFLRSLMSLLLVKVRRALRSSSSPVAENILAAHIHEVRDPIPGLIYNSRKPEDYAWLIISLAVYQYPIHLYMAIALRVANESLLSGDSENAWGFGQIVALILCATTLLECVKGVSDYRKRTQSERIIEEAEHVQAVGNIGRRNSY